jgi:carboxylesterase
LAHGLLSTPREFGLISGRLKTLGVDHQAFEVSGYTLARNGPPRPWQQWVTAASDRIAAAHCANRPLVLGGLCTGGLIAAAVALESRVQVDGLVLMAPSLAYDGWGLPPWTRLRHLAYGLGLDRFIRVAEREPYGIKNPAVRAWIAREMRERAVSAAGPAALPLWALRESERMTRYVLRQARELRCPVLVIHALEDEITTLAPVKTFFDALEVPDKRLVVLENSYHVITLDNDRVRVVEEVARFVGDIRVRSALSKLDSAEHGRWKVA